MSPSRAVLEPDKGRAAAVREEFIAAPEQHSDPACRRRAGARRTQGGAGLRRVAIALVVPVLAACGAFTDAATRIAHDIESQSGRLGALEGASLTIRHATPSKSGECTGPYKVQFDKVGALVMWCYDAAGGTKSSHSTTYHARFVDTRETFLVGKPAAAVLTIRLERRHGRAVIVEVS